ncbi:hypothetical protein FRB95_007955 [Tulasnella sp. JGI-2019a]|nr:hypothetical protein FRB93_008561 [Tulasnella sp. JGI-2019a]KAG9027272.1 hypothetical protein FRB95_007955 [Tulasnella sp. JGI-2019a]
MALTQNELFIRSASSLLHILRPHVVESRTSKEKSTTHANADKVQNQVERLDRMALLFTTKEFGQVTAVAISQHPDNVTVYQSSQTEELEKERRSSTTTRESDPTGTSRVYNVQNPPGTSQDPSNDAKKTRESDFKDMELFKRVQNIQTHAQQLAFLVNKLSGTATGNGEEEKTRLRHYVYFQCIMKIKACLELRSFVNGPPLLAILEKVHNELDRVNGPSPFRTTSVPISVRRTTSEQ